jgi:hypothetical protein
MWLQPWWRPELLLDPQECQWRTDAWHRAELLKAIRPKRRLCLPLFAAYANDVAGLEQRWGIGYSIGMSGTPDPRNDDVLPRFKGISLVVERGRQLAHDLGAWPWAEYQGGELADSWWTDEVLHEALKRAVLEYGLKSGRRQAPSGARNVCVALLPL